MASLGQGRGLIVALDELVLSGWHAEDGARWLLDCVLLAATSYGSQAAIIDSPAGTMGGQVYRELWDLERQIRSGLLMQMAETMSRGGVSSLGAATVELLLPDRGKVPGRKPLSLRRESRRGLSGRLFSALGAAGSREPIARELGAFREAMDSLDVPGPQSSLCVVAALAEALAESAEPPLRGVERFYSMPWRWARLARIEARLALGDTSRAQQLLDSAGPLRGVELDDAAEAASVEDRMGRLSVAERFLAGDVGAAVQGLDAAPLFLDRSASMYALRAVLREQSRGARGTGLGAAEPPPAAPRGDECERIARFLALAVPGTSKGPSPGGRTATSGSPEEGGASS